MKYVLSFDIAKNKSVVCLMDSNKSIIIKPFLINHYKNEFESLYNEVSSFDNLVVVMESTSIYHLPVENFFRNKGCIVNVMNPKLVKQFNDSLNKSKSDKIDSLKIARCFLSTIDEFRYKDDEYFKYNSLSRQYFSILEINVKLKNRYKQLLDIVFPEFAQIFPNLYSNMALNFIKNFPHPELFCNKRSDFLMNKLKEYNNTTQAFRFKNKVTKLKQLADNSLWFVSKDSFEVSNLVHTIDLIIYVENELKKLRTILIDSLKDTDLFKIIKSIPFISDINIALFLVEVGDISRFDDSSQLISFCGIDSVIKQSGTSISYNGPISKTGNKYARKLLFLMSTQIITLCALNDKLNPIYIYSLEKNKKKTSIIMFP